MSKNKKRRSGCGCFLLIIILCFAIYGGVYAANLYTAEISPSTTEDGAVIKTAPLTGNLINILALGSDGSDLLTDTIIVFQVNTKEKTVKSLSIPRDTQVTKNGHKIKINAAYGYSDRESSTIASITELTGLDIHYYATIGLDGFRDFIDYLGGVEIDVPQNMNYYDPAQNLTINIKKGLQHMDGKTAEGFVRFRSGYADADIGRMHAQQIFVKELARQKFTTANILNAKNIYNEAKKFVNTNMSMKSAVKIIKAMRSSDAEIQSFDLPGASQYIGGVSYYIADKAAINKLINTEFH